MSCEHCGGSGVLNVMSSEDLDTWMAEATSCHACPMGSLMKELGLD